MRFGSSRNKCRHTRKISAVAVAHREIGRTRLARSHHLLHDMSFAPKPSKSALPRKRLRVTQTQLKIRASQSLAIATARPFLWASSPGNGLAARCQERAVVSSSFRTPRPTPCEIQQGRRGPCLIAITGGARFHAAKASFQQLAQLFPGLFFAVVPVEDSLSTGLSLQLLRAVLENGSS